MYTPLCLHVHPPPLGNLKFPLCITQLHTKFSRQFKCLHMILSNLSTVILHCLKSFNIAVSAPPSLHMKRCKQACIRLDGRGCGDVFQNPLSLDLLFPHDRTVYRRSDQHLSWTSWSVQWRQHSPLAQRVYWALQSGVSHRYRPPPKREVEPKTWGRRRRCWQVGRRWGWSWQWRWWLSEGRFTTSLMCGFTRLD